MYKDLGSEEMEPIPVALLLKHPFMQDLINRYEGYKLHVSIPSLVSTVCGIQELCRFHCSENTKFYREGVAFVVYSDNIYEYRFAWESEEKALVWDEHLWG